MKTYREALREHQERLLQARKAYLTEVMAFTSGNIAQAARIAQLNRTNFYRVLRRYGIPVQVTSWGNEAWRSISLESRAI